MKYIKFRAWSVEDSRMVDLINVEDHFVFSKRLLHPDKFVPLMLVGRCVTGDIYEGDIVLFDVVKGDRDDEQEIRFEKGIVAFNPIGGTSYGVWAAQCCRNVKVIGNIYEDKEMADNLRVCHGF